MLGLEHEIIHKSEKGIDINQCLKLFTEEEQLGTFYDITYLI